MAKKKVKQKKRVTKRTPKKTGLVKGNSFLIPKYIRQPETLWQRIYRWFCG
jgi:hypothetical protein